MPALKPRSGATHPRKPARHLLRKTLKLKGPKKTAIGANSGRSSATLVDASPPLSRPSSTASPVGFES